MFRIIACLLTSIQLLLATEVLADVNVVVVDGIPYELTKQVRHGCSLNAMKFALEGGMNFGKNRELEKCVRECSGPERECQAFCMTNPEKIREQKMAGLNEMLKAVRKFPPSYKNRECADGRQVCQEMCISADGGNEMKCLIDCNQYESYYKRS